MKEPKVVNNLKEFRCSLDMTQQDLAEKVDVSRQTIISIEKGKYTPSVFLALKISNIFSKNVNEIFSLKNK